MQRLEPLAVGPRRCVSSRVRGARLSLALLLACGLGCDALNLKSDSKATLTVVKTAEVEGGGLAWTANVRIQNDSSVPCRLLNYELTWEHGNKAVILDPTPRIAPGDFVIKDVSIGAIDDPDDVANISGTARCVAE